MISEKFNLKYLLLLFFIISAIPLSAADEDPFKGNLAVFKAPQKNIELNAIANESVNKVNEVFNSLGRFMNVEYNRMKWAFENTAKGKPGEIFNNAARLLKVDIYAVVNIYRRGNVIISEMKIVPLSKFYKKLGSIIIVKSRIGINIPLKLAVETAYLHKNLNLRAKIEKRYNDNFHILSAGQWHGIKPGVYRTDQGVDIEVIKTGRYRSLVKLPSPVPNRGLITIPIYPDYEKTASRLKDNIRFTALYQYGLGRSLLQGADPEKKFIEGVCVINTGANLCLPGYGSFLSTRYLGFKGNTPSITGVTISAGLILTHFTLPMFMSGFKINFFPGVNDGDKSESIKNLQYFLWAALPITFTVSYFDQLAYQFNKNRYLPPFFDNMDEAALTFSLLFPGGGLFYKGRRLEGWAYYFTEMSLVGYAVYNSENSKKFKYAFGIFGIVKLIELINAYFIKPSYKFYNMEMERGKKRSSFSFGINRGPENENIYKFAVFTGF